MEDYRRQAKIEALNKAFPGKSCGNPRCEELCAEAYAAAKSMRLDPADAVRRTIERELPCMSVTQNTAHSCRFGFMPLLESVALGREEKKQERENTIIHVFRTGVNECEKCQKLDGTRISPEDWADEERMKKKGFWKQKNGEYLPHPHCKCHWEEEIEIPNNKTEGKKIGDAAGNSLKSKSLAHKNDTDFQKGKSQRIEMKGNSAASTKHKKGGTVYCHLEGSPGKYGDFGGGICFNGLDDLIKKLEQENYLPHSIDLLVIIAHGGQDNSYYAAPDKNKKDREHLGDISDLQAARLKKFLHRHSIVDLRFCKAAEGKEGKNTAIQLAKKLGCTIRAYEGYVAPTGGRVPWLSKQLNHDESRFFPDNKPRNFHFRDVEIK